MLKLPPIPQSGWWISCAVGAISQGSGITTVVDSTFASPYLQRPLDYPGIDVVLHSATKYIGGHGDTMGGIIIGKKELIYQVRLGTLVNMGGVIDPFGAWLLLRGLKTIHLRVERQSESAMEIARFLESHPKVERVYYPGLPSPSSA